MPPSPKIRIVTLSHTVGRSPYNYAALLEYGDGKRARLEFEVEVPQPHQNKPFDLAGKEFRLVLAALQQAEHLPTDESSP